MKSQWKCIKSFNGLEQGKYYTLPVPVEFVRANKGDPTAFYCKGFRCKDVIVKTADLFRYLTPHTFTDIKDERKAKLEKLWKNQ